MSLLDTLEIPEEWGVLASDGDGEADAAADARMTANARDAVAALRDAPDEWAVRRTLAAFVRGWDGVCDQNPSASDTDVREGVRAFFEELVSAAGFEGRAARWWSEAAHGYLDREIPELSTRLEAIGLSCNLSPGLTAERFAALTAQVRDSLAREGVAEIPGLVTLRARDRWVSVHRWADANELDPEDPPRAATEPHVTALLKNVREQGPVHVPALGIVGERVYPGYEGRNPRTGEAIPVPEKRIFTLLLDEELVQAALGRPST